MKTVCKTSVRALFLVILLVVMTLPGCNLFQHTTTTAPVVINITPIIVDTTNPLFSDDFSNPKSGWTAWSDDSSNVAYENGEYSVLQNSSGSMTWGHNPNMSDAADFAAEVDARVLSLGSDGNYGFVFRCQKQRDENSFYSFVINGGSYIFRKCLQGTWSTIQTWIASSYINIGGTNRLKVVCNGTQIDLYVNNQLLDSFQDASIDQGYVGLVASQAGTHVHFDNFKLYGIASMASGNGPAIYVLSPESAFPGSILTIDGYSFEPADSVSVLFAGQGGISIEVPATKVTATAITVSVPPFINSKTGVYGSGTVGVQVIQKSGTNKVASNVISGFLIKDLVKPALPPGAVTLSFLNGAVSLAQNIQNNIKGTSMETASLDAANTAQVSHLTTLAGHVSAVVKGSSKSFNLGTIAGQSIILSSSDLLSVDRMIMGMLAEQAGVNKTADSNYNLQGYLSFVSFPIGNQLPIPEFAENQRIDALDYYTALINGDPAYQQYALSYMGNSANSTAQAVSTGMNVVLGAGGVAMGILALGGAPEIALALPAAALLYVTIVGSGGEIGLGGALHNINVSGAKQFIQDGAERIEDYLESELVGVLNETAGTLYSLFSDSKSLYHEFKTPLETSTGNGVFTGTFSGTLGTASDGYGTTYSYSVSGTIQLTLTQNSNGTVTGTANIPANIVCKVVYSPHGVNFQGGSLSQTATGPISGTNSKLNGTFASTDSSPITVVFTGVRNGNTITGSITISETFHVWWTGDLEGDSYPNLSTTISNLVLTK